jgi:hypothetical protein
LEVKGAGKITLTWILGRCAMKREVDGTGSESFLTAGFGINSVEPSGSATRKLLIINNKKFCNGLMMHIFIHMYKESSNNVLVVKTRRLLLYMDETRNSYRILVGKTFRKLPLRRLSRHLFQYLQKVNLSLYLNNLYRQQPFLETVTEVSDIYIYLYNNITTSINIFMV